MTINKTTETQLFGRVETLLRSGQACYGSLLVPVQAPSIKCVREQGSVAKDEALGEQSNAHGR